MNSNQKPLRVWCLLRDQFAHVKPVEEAFGVEAEFIYDADWKPEKLVAAGPDVVLCVNDFHYDVALCLEAAKRHGIPSLSLQDGILEWRCQYENPLFGTGGGAPQHQPVLADKIACLGDQSARQIAAWGNADKVEVTGMPRLDYLLTEAAPPMHKPGNRILVMTAKNPGFTPEQREITVRSLKELKKFLDSQAGLEVFWRVSPKVVNELGVENQYQQAASPELAAILKQVDVVITTPSTAMLEGMLLNRPVAALDYHNVPRFVPTAWTISAPEHIAAVVNEIRNPPARKIAFQKDCLADCLRCDGPAAPRVVQVVRSLAQRMSSAAESDVGGAARAAPMPQPVPFRDLYPEQPAFAENDVQVLRLKLARLEGENGRLRKQVQARNIPAFLVSKLYRWWKRPRRNKVS